MRNTPRTEPNLLVKKQPFERASAEGRTGKESGANTWGEPAICGFDFQVQIQERASASPRRCEAARNRELPTCSFAQMSRRAGANPGEQLLIDFSRGWVRTPEGDRDRVKPAIFCGIGKVCRKCRGGPGRLFGPGQPFQLCRGEWLGLACPVPFALFNELE